MKHPSLKINFLWAFFGNAVSAFCLWLLLVVLTKTASVEVMGLFGLAQAVALPVSMLFSLKLQLANVTDARHEYTNGHYIAIKIITSVLTVITIGLIGVVFYPLKTAAVIFVLGVGYAINEVREYFLSIMQKYERMDLMSLSRIGQGLLSLALFGGVFWLTKSLVAAIFGIIATRLILLFCYDIPTSAKLAVEHLGGASAGFRPLWERAMLWRLVRLTAPLGLVAWLGTLFTSIPRIVMDEVSGRDSVGYFTAMSSLLVVGTMITSAMGQTTNPRMAKYFIEDRTAFSLLFLKLLGISAVLGASAIVLAVLFGKPILTFLFTADYAQHNNVFILVTFAGCILFVFHAINSALTSTRQFAVQLPIYAAAAAVCGGCSLLLIPRYDMIGAAWSLIICYVVGSLVCLVFIIKALERIPLKK